MPDDITSCIAHPYSFSDLDYVDYEHMLAKLAQHGVTRLRIKRFQAAVGQRLPGGVLSKAPMQEVKQEPQL